MVIAEAVICLEMIALKELNEALCSMLVQWHFLR